MSRFGNLGRLVIFGFIDFNFGLPVLSTCDLENNLQLDRRAEGKASDAVNQRAWVLCLFRRCLATTPKRHQPLFADRARLLK